jgi:dihydropteroate synthase
VKDFWITSRRKLSLDQPLVMAIMNVTPDSFSDGGEIASVDDALRRAEKFIAEGADILDIGGESTRPGSSRVDIEDELKRTSPIVSEIAKRFDIPISVDTSKAAIANVLIDDGAEIINDISGLRWDEEIADVAAQKKTGLVLMHSRGDFETMHTQPPVDDIFGEVTTGLRTSIETAKGRGVKDEQIVLDVGIGFGKTAEQNLELIAKLDKMAADFPRYPMLIGSSRKSFIGKLLDDLPVEERLGGSLATAALAVWNGASIVRAHDVRETVETLKIVRAMRNQL